MDDFYGIPEQVPPHSLPAEQALIGAVLRDRGAYELICDQVTPADFYALAHRHLWQSITDLMDTSQPCDIVTVAEKLHCDGRMDDVGGMSYLGQIVSASHATANVLAYAKLVSNMAMLRALLTAANEQIEAVHNPSGRDAQALLSSALSRLSTLEERGSLEHVAITAKEAAARAIDHIERMHVSGDGMEGVPTGWPSLDKLTRGLEPSSLVILAARPSMGKAQPLDAKVLTLGGWKAMGDLQVGDALASIDGNESFVSGVFPQGEKQIYRITFADGRSTECCSDHLWLVNYRAWNEPRVMSTTDLINHLAKKRYQGRLWVDTYSGVFGGGNLPIDPWVMGAILGNGGLSGGHVGFSTNDIETLKELEAAVSPEYKLTKSGKYSYRIIQSNGCHVKGSNRVTPNNMKESLISLGLFGLKSSDKFIPQEYLNAAFDDRLALMQGLMDTDGWVEKTGAVCFSSSSKALADDFIYLARSLGCTASYTIKQPCFSYKGLRKTGLDAYTCRIQCANKSNLFRLSRKSERAKVGERARRLTVASIEPSRVANAQCIKVTHSSSTYVTDDFIVTHNTTFGVQLAQQVAAKADKPVLVFSLEMSVDALGLRMISSLGRIDHDKVRSGKLEGEDEWGNLTLAVNRMAALKLHIDDQSGLTVQDIIVRAKRFHREQGGLSLIVIDYLGLIAFVGRVENQNLGISQVTAALKGLAKSLKVPVVLLSQLNRNLEQRPNKRPIMADLRDCLPVDEWVDTPTGPAQLRDRPARVVAVNDTGAIQADAEFIEKRYNRVYRVWTQFGDFCATARHRVLTGTGWKQVCDLVPGRDVVASPKRIPHANRGEQPHARLLGWLLGNGSLSGTPGLTYRVELHDEVEQAVALFGVRVNPRSEQKSPSVIDAYLSNGVETGSLENPLMTWIRELGLEGKRSHEKSIPSRYLGSSDATHIDLLRGLWETDGTVCNGTAKYATVSELLARQVRWLLLTIGVRAKVHCEIDGCNRPLWIVQCAKADNPSMVTVVAKTGRFGVLSEPSYRYMDVSPALFTEMAAELSSHGRRFQKRADGNYKRLSKTEMELVLDQSPITTIAESPYMRQPGVGWGDVQSVELVKGPDVRVCDLHVADGSCFIVNGVVVHNSGSIEQDADLIAFIYRDEVYHPESPDAGTAELIVAKHRNGKTDTLRYAFLGKYCRFDELAYDWQPQKQAKQSSPQRRSQDYEY